MVFLRKLLSVANLHHQQFAIDLWCSWLEQGLLFDAQQEVRASYYSMLWIGFHSNGVAADAFAE